MDITRLLAFDTADLIVMSAHLEGSKVMRSNIAYLPHEKRFVLVVVRHDAENPEAHHVTGLHFNRVERVLSHHLPDGTHTEPLTLIGMAFEPAMAPSGFVVLMFEGPCAIRLQVECLEASLSDLPPQPAAKDS
jgi:hypothetical protein